MIGRLRRSVNAIRWGPTHWIYVLAHALVFLFGAFLVALGGEFLVPIGTAMIAAGLAGWIIFVYVLFTQRKAEAVELLTDFGLQQAYNERGPNIREEYDIRLNKANEAIDIMGFGLRTFREDQGDYFEGWAHSLQVRVLLIDPEFPREDHTYAEQRDKEEGDDIGNIRRDVRNFIDETSHLIQNDDANFEVRLHQCLPSMTVFRIDNEIFWGPYTVKNQSRNMPTFLVGNHGEMYDFLKNHFEVIWEDDELSRSVPEEWLT